MKFFLSDENKSIEFAKRMAELTKVGTVYALKGELGTGKTFFTQHLCKEIGVEDYVNSPSYILMNEYNGVCPVFHFDLYRLSSPEEILELGIYDLFPQGITFIEWPEIAEEFLPKETIHLKFSYPDNSIVGRFLEIEALDETRAKIEDILLELSRESS